MERLSDTYLKQNQTLKLRTVEQPQDFEKFATPATLKLYGEFLAKATEHNKSVEQFQKDVEAIVAGTIPPTGAVDFAARLKVRRIELAGQLVELIKQRNSITEILTKEWGAFRNVLLAKYNQKKAEATEQIKKQFPTTGPFSNLHRDAVNESCKDALQAMAWTPAFVLMAGINNPVHEITAAKYQFCQAILRATNCDDIAHWPETVEV